MYKTNLYLNSFNRYRFVIYKISLGKYFYIGITKNIKSRFRQHIKCINNINKAATNNTFLNFHKVFGDVILNSKMGINDVKIEVIYRGTNIELMYEKEVLFINEMMSKNCLNVRKY